MNTKQKKAIEHFQMISVKENIDYLLSGDIKNYANTEQFLAVYDNHLLDEAVFNLLLSFCQQVLDRILLEAVISLADRWERLGVDTPEKAIQQSIEDYEVLSIFKSGLGDKVLSKYPEFNYQAFKAGLSQPILPKATINSVPKSTIVQLSNLYSFSYADMETAFVMALDENLEVTISTLNKASAELYRIKKKRTK